LIGSTSNPPAAGNITGGTGIVVTNGANSISLAVSGSVVGQTITGNSGGALSPTAGNWNILTSNANVQTQGSGSTLTLNFAGDGVNLLVGAAGAISSGSSNVGFGILALAAISSGADNTAIGYSALTKVNTGNYNVAVGDSALSSLTSGDDNVGIGYFSLSTFTTGTGRNVAIGSGSLDTLLTGTENVCIGYQAGHAYTGTETNNIIIGYGIVGTIAESNVIRIGNASNTSCYITGIDGVNVGSVAKVITEASNQLGTATITAGPGTTVTATANTITINTSGVLINKYTSTAISYQVLVTDTIVGVTSNAAARTITMPNAGMTAGQEWTIKDEAGTAQSANNITISGHGANIDGAATFVINTNYGSATLYWNGSNFFIK
jgi:hypothetical protein